MTANPNLDPFTASDTQAPGRFALVGQQLPPELIAWKWRVATEWEHYTSEVCEDESLTPRQVAEACASCAQDEREYRETLQDFYADPSTWKAKLTERIKARQLAKWDMTPLERDDQKRRELRQWGRENAQEQKVEFFVEV